MGSSNFDSCKPDMALGKAVAWVVSKGLPPGVDWWFNEVLARQNPWLCYKESCLKPGANPSIHGLQLYINDHPGDCEGYIQENFTHTCVRMEDWSLSTINRCTIPTCDYNSLPIAGFVAELLAYCRFYQETGWWGGYKW